MQEKTEMMLFVVPDWYKSGDHFTYDSILTEFENVVKKGRDERGWCSDRALRHRT